MENEDFVTYEQSVKLKELGFGWECSAYYYMDSKEFRGNISPDNHNYRSEIVASAPTHSQAQKWLREVKNIIIIVEPMYAKNRFAFNYAIFTFKDKPITLEQSYKACINYEQALSAGIDKALEILKTENK